MISARSKVNFGAGGLLIGAAVLYRFSPEEFSFYPRCPFFALTHHLCPGCGATRAIAALLHGQLAAAFEFNAAVTLLSPFLLGYFAVLYSRAALTNRLEWPAIPAWSWKGALVCFGAFAVARMLVQGTI